jgi:hypothetical protein
MVNVRRKVLAQASLDWVVVLSHVSGASSPRCDDRRLEGRRFEISRVELRRVRRTSHVASAASAVGRELGGHDAEVVGEETRVSEASET